MAIPEIAQAGKLLAEAVAILRAELKNVKQSPGQAASLARGLAFLEISLQAARSAWGATATYITLADRAADQTAKEMANREPRSQRPLPKRKDQAGDPAKAAKPAGPPASEG